MTLSERYERWFEQGTGALRQFLEQENCSETQLTELVLLDQHLRYKAGQAYEPTQYEGLPGFFPSDDLRLELWLEAYGYAEQEGISPNEFLERVPEELRADVREQCPPIAANAFAGPPEMDRYRIDGELGRGAFGIVYRAWDKQLDRGVALKVLCGQPASNQTSTDSTFAEARLVAGLEHPGLVAVYDCGMDQDGRAFFVTQLVEGRSLNEWASDFDARRETDRKQICKLFAKLCDALAAAHQRGVVHRDLKPGNVLVREDGDPVVLDFGLALSDWSPGRDREWVGTPAYMSPEQARGEGHLVDPRSDVFALGILLFEALTDERPWKSDSTRELLREIAHGSVDRVRTLIPSIPIELESVCRKATAASMSDRYASAREMGNDLHWLSESDGAPSDGVEDASQSVVPIAARGLCPYGAEDSASYWAILPGYRNARGIPESVAWWLERLQSDRGQRGAVLVLYGPSGSGKSSLLHAGVLPFLDSRRSLICKLDASEFQSAEELAAELARMTNRESVEGLSGLVSELRDRSSRHCVIALDQFEQILAWEPAARERVALALRQADGTRLQVILVVRDEFWSATSQLMRDLDAPLRDDRNAMGLERFSAVHARHVLGIWGQSAPAGSVIDDAFVDTAITLVEENDRVIPVRLALLACVLGDEPWNLARLKAIAQRGSLSARYLDSILGLESSARAKRFSEPARRVLSELTPISGVLRGPARSTAQLRRASQLSNAEFEDLLDLLDRRSHLITPVDRSENSSDDGDASEYNLPHDFLVPELRHWLEEIERTTAQGRAAADLRVAARRWNKDRTSKDLAGPLECLRFTLLARPSEVVERSFLRASAKRGLVRSMAVALLAIAAAAFFQFALLRANGQSLVQRLGDCGFAQLPDVIEEVRQRWTFAEAPLRSALDRSIERGDVAKQDRLALALLASEPEQSSYLSDRVLECEPELLRQILSRLRQDLVNDDAKATVDRFASVASDEMYENDQRLRAAIAIASLAPSHPFWEQSSPVVCEMLVASDPTEIGWMAEGFAPVGATLRPGLTSLVAENDSEQLRTATFLLAKFASDDEKALVDILENALLPQLSAVAPTIRGADHSINRRLEERLEQRLDDYLDVAMDMEMYSLNMNPSFPSGQGSVLSKRRVLLARRIGNLAALLLQRDRGRKCFELLRSSTDLTLRSYIIQCYAVSEGPAEPIARYLVEPLNRNSDSLPPDVAAALLQILGSLPASSQVPSVIRELSQRWSRDSDHAELNASAEWYLRHHGYHQDLGEFPKGSAFAFRTKHDHVMVRLPAATAVTVGASTFDANQLANERSHAIDVPEGVYFSRHEVSVRQFNRFLESRRRPLIETRGGPESASAMRVSFYQAAAYCNWMSEQDGIAEDEWCFLPNRNGHYAAGMSVVEDHLSREGYQFPTADLWEYACRAGSETPRHYGYGVELSTPYVRWMGSGTSSSRSRVPLRKPNAFGLFDMLGNASEWSLSIVSESESNFPSVNVESRQGRRFLERSNRPGLAFGGGPEHEDASGKTIGDRTRLLMLGGAFDSPAHKVRSSDRSLVSPPITNQPIGIRLMRIIRE